MATKFTQLQCKEVICVRDGRRLGYISDVLVEIPDGSIAAIVVPGPGKCCGLLGRKEDYRIPWHSICKIGPDIVLVDADPSCCRIPRPKSGFSL